MRVTYEQIASILCNDGKKIASKIFGKRKSLTITEENIEEYAKKVQELYYNDLKIGHSIGTILYNLLKIKVSEEAAGSFSHSCAWENTPKAKLLKLAKSNGLKF